jgi:hypothetical protein
MELSTSKDSSKIFFPFAKMAEGDVLEGVVANRYAKAAYGMDKDTTDPDELDFVLVLDMQGGKWEEGGPTPSDPTASDMDGTTFVQFSCTTASAKRYIEHVRPMIGERVVVTRGDNGKARAGMSAPTNYVIDTPDAPRPPIPKLGGDPYALFDKVDEKAAETKDAFMAAALANNADEDDAPVAEKAAPQSESLFK